MLKPMALIFGIVFIAAGAAGFIPALSPPAMHPGLTGDLAEHGSAMALGLLPVNTLHNIVHLLFGLIGLGAARSVGGARGYFQFIFVAYALLAVLGLIPATQSLFGFVPLHGNDVYFHGILALAGLYLGFIHKERTVEIR